MRTTNLTRVTASRRGSTIVPALLVVMAVATMSITYLQVILAKGREQKASIDQKRAFYMAEAGLAEGFNGLVQGKSGNVASEKLPARFANGVLWTSCKDEGAGRYTLKSTGLCGAGRATLALTVECSSTNPGAQGIFGEKGATIEPGCTIDTFDSATGTLLTPPRLDPPETSTARVGSNGDIHAPAGAVTHVYGSVAPGPDHALYRGGTVEITGSIAPSTNPVTRPEVVIPDFASEGPLVVPPSLLATTITGDHEFTTLDVRPGAKLRIVGPATIVAPRLLAGRESFITIDATLGPVEIHVTDWLSLGTGSTLRTKSWQPGNATLHVSGSKTIDRTGDGIPEPPIEFQSSGSYYGTIFAPDADVALPSGFQLFGAAYGRTLTLLGGSSAHFDRALLRPSPGQQTTPRLLAWRIVEIPVARLASMRYDALQFLLDKGLNPPLSKDALLDNGVLQATSTLLDWSR